MPDVKAIEAAVSALPPQDLALVREWFAEFDAAAWERRIESDVAASKLDECVAEAQADLQSTELCATSSRLPFQAA